MQHQTQQTSSRPQAKKLVLIVDDDAVNRMILEGMLEAGGYAVVTAADGQQAIQQYIEHQPQVILMDIIMPVLDGFQATIRIKELAGDSFVPIIFLTAVSSEEELAKCVRMGGDDFLTKPYSKVILMAKVEALVRMSQLYATIRQQRDEIDIHNSQMLAEQKVAKKIFSKVVHEGCLHTPNIKYLLSPLSIFNGDLLLAARTPSGGLNILLGDATGHGLPAAIGAVPVSDLFYELTDNGATVDEIVLAINAKLKNILPPEFFFCACVLNLSNDSRLLTLWHGGLPDVLIYSGKNRKLRYAVRSTNFPLGVVSNRQLKTRLHVFDLEAGDRVYLYSDGIIEARNMQNEQFSSERLQTCFERGKTGEQMFDHILQSVKDFCAEQVQSDDLTLLELTANAELIEHTEEQGSLKIESLPYPETWSISMTLSQEDFLHANPVSILTRFASQVEGLNAHRENIFVLLSELYNNALDHGVLELDSTIKSGPDGFIKYLELRQQRLLALDAAEITINVENRILPDSGELHISVIDSGRGFDYTQTNKQLALNQSFSGRGLPLLRTLCRELKYLGKGNHVTAIYEWKRPVRSRG